LIPATGVRRVKTQCREMARGVRTGPGRAIATGSKNKSREKKKHAFSHLGIDTGLGKGGQHTGRASQSQLKKKG